MRSPSATGSLSTVKAASSSGGWASTKISRSSVSGWSVAVEVALGAVVVEHEHEPAAQVVDVGPAVGLDGGAQGVGVALHVGDGDELLVVEHRSDLLLDGGEGVLGDGDRLHEAEVERIGDRAVLGLEVDHEREVVGVVVATTPRAR